MNLFPQAIGFARKNVNITNTDISIILQDRRTPLFNGDIQWVKQSDNADFDVPMGSYDGADVGELIDAFPLNNLSHVIEKSSVGLYRDDDLGVFKNQFDPESKRKRKEKTFNTLSCQ